jgi:long-chain acyl-CoA synthetase
LVGPQSDPEKVFHYLPFSFAASWIAMLSFISRNSALSLSTDLTKLADELKIASPNYFLNVPTLLERVRRTIQETIQKRGTFAATVFSKAQDAYGRRSSSQGSFVDTFWLALANRFMFPTIRAGIGPSLKGLICGSAPLSMETQQFFMMLGIPVLQVYGLTETTAICTMDDPHRVVAGCVEKFWRGGRTFFRDIGSVRRKARRCWKAGGFIPEIRAKSTRPETGELLAG